MRASLRALIGLVVFAVGLPTIAFAWYWIGGLGMWITHSPQKYANDVDRIGIHVVAGLLTLIALFFVSMAIYGVAQASWTERLLQAIERRLPKKIPPLSELISGSKQGNEARAAQWAEWY